MGVNTTENSGVVVNQKRVSLSRVLRLAYGIMGETPTPKTLPSGGPVDNDELLTFESPQESQENVPMVIQETDQKIQEIARRGP